MIRTISQPERLDILLALALVFRQPDESGDEQTAVQLAEKSFSALSRADFETLKTRAALFDSLPPKNRRLWQSFWLDKIRRRGRSVRLDEHINPLRMAEILEREPRTIQLLILRNLAPDARREVARRLGVEKNLETRDAESPTPTAEIVAVVRRKFLSYFVALEDVYEPTAIDKFTAAELSAFVRTLGIRETATACRAISSKETLAVFLNRFDAENAREIVRYITEMEKVKQFWVILAEKLLRETWNPALEPGELLQIIGLKLLAAAMFERDETAVRYTMQKLAPSEAQRLSEYIGDTRDRISPAGADEEKTNLYKRRKTIERLAEKFIESGRMES
ncbi:MAG TPA: hypothetical protein VK400_12070 [Pyrinomonadaceae bacterium]|nr:hypothetical protein [Pyrinomonadaceae bacterium]